MKFITVVVMLVLAYSANASVVPLGSPWGLGSPIGLSPYGLSSLGLSSLGVSPLAYSQLGLPGSVAINSLGLPLAVAPQQISLTQGINSLGIAPQIALSHGIARIAAPVVAAPILSAAEGSYVAANRGSVHVAPLPGHIQSTQSLNLQPAPGTW